MSALHPFAALLLSLVSQTASQIVATPQVECRDWQECRAQALAAAGSQDYERFHDLAWLAFRKGPANSPDLMSMLARAQSLSGRPHDALVMLQRIIALGAVPANIDDEAFERVRELPGWAELEARMAPPPATPTSGASSASPIAAAPKPSSSVETKAAKKEDPDAGVVEAAEAVRLTTDPYVPSGLAYDAVSNRFIVADRRERKLSVIGERSQRISSFVGPESAGFGEIDALAIDTRQGDLWVSSTNSDRTIGAKLHKLQLISGRLLSTEKLGADATPARFADVAVTTDGAVLVLDALGSRLFRLDPAADRTNGLKLAAALDLSSPRTIASAPDSIVYVAHAEGIARVSLQSKSARALTVSKDVNLAGLSWMRWHRGGLIGVQQTADGTHQIVRVRLGSGGTAVTRLDVLQRDVPGPDAPVAVISGDSLYYLTIVTAPSGRAETVIRKISLT